MRSRNFDSSSIVILALLVGACSSPSNHRIPSGPAFTIRQEGSSTRGPGFQKEEGFTFGLYAAQSPLGDDLDGETALVGSEDVIVLPSYGSGTGVGFSLGSRWAELYFESTEHEGDFGGASFDGTLRTLGFRGRLLPGRFKESRFQPYFMLGFGLNSLTIDDGSSDGSQVGDAKLAGVNAELGGGAFYHLSRKLSLHLDLAQRWLSFGSAEGVAGEGSLDDSIKASGVAGSLGMTITL